MLWPARLRGHVSRLRRLSRLPQGTHSHLTSQLIRMFSIAGEWQLFMCLPLDMFMTETRAFGALAQEIISRAGYRDETASGDENKNQSQ